MGDIDILVKEEDFPKVREYLIAEGYKEEDDGHNIHRSFIMENGINFEIEVHWNVINEDYFSYDKAEFEDKLWINSISRGSYRILRIDELIVYLIMHMAVHARYSGFGIRQVYDIAIIDRVDRNKINWNNILAECHKYGMRKFAEGILVILNIYFDNKLPKEVMDFISVSEDDACELLEHIFESGVHGKRLENEDYLELSRYEYIKNKMSFIKRILRLFFPRKELIIEDYKYLKKLPILFPYACIHYDITKGLIKKYSLIENVGNIKYSIKLGKKRCRIIKLFDL